MASTTKQQLNALYNGSVGGTLSTNSKGANFVSQGNAPAALANTTTTTNKTPLQTKLDQRQQSSADQINKIYDNQYKAEKQKLKGDYDLSKAQKQREREKIAPQYQSQANALAANYEQQRRNANLSALTNGLANGVGQQQQNAMSNVYAQNYGALRGQEADAINTANQGIADLTTAYNNALVNSQSSINAKRDQELLKNKTANQEWYEKQVQNLAANGDFTEYAKLYGKDAAKAARNTWIAKNPDIAYRSGKKSKKDYKKITGKDPTYKRS